MSTQRPNEDPVISSGFSNNTSRETNVVISSGMDGAQIISSSLINEVILNGQKYDILKMIARSGESEIFLVSKNGDQFVFKYYYSQYKPKDEVLSKLKGLQHADIICLIDHGYYQNRFFEISEYALGGTLQDIMPVNSIEKIKEIVGETIEALEYCHLHGIIHRDIKPENIFYRTIDKKDIAIGDFGIASNVKEGEELVRTSLARTNLYAAPELFTAIQGKTTIDKSVDYYAMGMTLLHLWFGRNPFEDIDEFGIMRLKSEGRIAFPDDIDEAVETLIKGLITVNPLDRWGYGEVKRWLGGEEVPLNYHTQLFEYKPYSFGVIDGEQIVVSNPKDLAYYLEKYPEKGEGHLYRNTIAKWMETVDPGLYNELMDVVEKEYPRNKTAGLTKAIYILDNEKPFIGVDKVKLGTQEEIALNFEENFSHYEADLKNPDASFYMFLEARNYKAKADEFRGYFNITNAEAALNSIILKLQGGNKFVIGSYEIFQPEELIRVDDQTKTLVVNQLANVNSKLSLWMAGFEHLQTTIDKWRSFKRYDEVTLRYALQAGLDFNGTCFNTVAEFFQAFKNNYAELFSVTDAAKNQTEADYWLKHYMNTDFSQMVTDYLNTEKCTDEEFRQMIHYVLSEHGDGNFDVYRIMQSVFSVIKERISGNSALFESVVGIVSGSIARFWDEVSKTQSGCFLDSLKEYLRFVENNTGNNEFFSQLTHQLNDRIEYGIRNDIEQISNIATEVKKYRSELQIVVKRLMIINPELPYINRFNRELLLIQDKTRAVKQKIQTDKQEKISITNKKYLEILHQHRKGFIAETRGTFNRKIIWSLVLFIISIGLLVLSKLYGGSVLPVLSIVLGGLGAIIGFVLGSLSKNGFWMFVFIFGLSLLGYYLGTKIPLDAVYLTLVSFEIFFGIRCVIFFAKRNKEIKAVTLDSNEKAALQQSLADVNRYFSDKESYDVLQETVRVLLLDKRAFEDELA